MTLAERLKAFNRADLYVVITASFCGGRPGLEVLRQTLEAGVRLVQMREKDLEGGALYRQGLEFRRLTAAAGALLIVNDRLDIALAVEADGVHLGQDDLPIEAARRLAPELIIGASTHSLEEVLSAQAAGAGYVNIGPIFPTKTKETAAIIGLAALEQIPPHLRIPWTTMGGITLANVHEVVSRGARHPAVMTAVTAAADPTLAARRLREVIKQGSGL
jgi:thiamine-phosphate pyrophosphorylase